MRTFGANNLATTPARDITIRDNIIVDTIGNTDGTETQYRPLFGMGLYIDFFSANVISEGNTVIGSTLDGILYQNSSGQIVDNTCFHNSQGTIDRGNVGLYL